MEGAAAVDPLSWPRWVGMAFAAATTLCAGLSLGFVSLNAPNLALVALIVASAWIGCLDRLAPRTELLGKAAVVLASVALAGNPGTPVLFVVCIIVGDAAIERPLRQSGALFGLAVVSLLVRAATVGGHFTPLDYLPWPLGFSCSWAGGLFVGTQVKLNAQLRANQADVAARAATDERRRLAREIHDVIAHSMTVTMLHVGGARLALQDQPPGVVDALEALTEAERQGRQSLADIRRTVGLLTTGTPEESQLAAPAPTLADVPALVAGFVDAGLGVTLRSEGDLDAVPPTVGLAAYRVVQESLANAAKHAPGAAVGVDVRVCHGSWPLSSFSVVTGRSGRVDVEVSNSAPTSAAPLVDVPAGGLGVPGMAERIEALGGRLSAGPQGDGWRVCARLPIGADATFPAGAATP